MGVYQVVCQQFRDNGLPNDTTENVFHFREVGDEPDDDHQDAIVAALVEMYGSVLTSDIGLQHQPISAYYGEQVVSGSDAGRGLIYFRSDEANTDEHMGSPIREFALTYNGSLDAVKIPSEVCGKLSASGDTTNVPEEARVEESNFLIRPAAWRRGGIYFGPLCGAAIAEIGTSNEPGLSPNFVHDLAIAGQWLAHEAELVTCEWVIYSKSTRTPVPDSHLYFGDPHGAIYTVVKGFVDNAPDTERRRGIEATARTNWS